MSVNAMAEFLYQQKLTKGELINHPFIQYEPEKPSKYLKRSHSVSLKKILPNQRYENESHSALKKHLKKMEEHIGDPSSIIAKNVEYDGIIHNEDFERSKSQSLSSPNAKRLQPQRVSLAQILKVTGLDHSREEVLVRNSPRPGSRGSPGSPPSPFQKLKSGRYRSTGRFSSNIGGKDLRAVIDSPPSNKQSRQPERSRQTVFRRKGHRYIPSEMSKKELYELAAERCKQRELTKSNIVLLRSERNLKMGHLIKSLEVRTLFSSPERENNEQMRSVSREHRNDIYNTQEEYSSGPHYARPLSTEKLRFDPVRVEKHREIIELSRKQRKMVHMERKMLSPIKQQSTIYTNTYTHSQTPEPLRTSTPSKISYTQTINSWNKEERIKKIKSNSRLRDQRIKRAKEKNEDNLRKEQKYKTIEMLIRSPEYKIANKRRVQYLKKFQKKWKNLIFLKKLSNLLFDKVHQRRKELLLLKFKNKAALVIQKCWIGFVLRGRIKSLRKSCQGQLSAFIFRQRNKKYFNLKKDAAFGIVNYFQKSRIRLTMRKFMLGYKSKSRKCLKGLKLNNLIARTRMENIQTMWESHILQLAQKLNKSHFPSHNKIKEEKKTKILSPKKVVILKK